ncbi:ATP-dependent DNA helicase, UvrD/REP family [Mycolicibacterium phlei]|uniref:DNA 3'-5' helicase n=1 Tax=Mycolicibacterium phlei DSM 43239 = CCUG 21000 TaxID=1226750 RepID=A0A5N5V717_MYCPH|nr:3'-5' exonuclease [Mycolicibacterium phlei]VEG08036.1 ATP-dependent DNA helicase, UvrD/REP family [Mycobacteroides chelonae]AMO59910.1 DNA-dependent helicase II [Mycolicibacterium phlei]KAB7757705.1 DNA helicase UvrD [Mycolicibacterium phlei DSM 43239 = CCUG 21000]KXW61262.1 DNA helicase UvrD [Mycolicibacterium phlei DSM 43239 = CCUG 21000]KXW63779.1 DNA helicase UvrD [Mycolicibacterium phlei DSM 43070]
MANLVIASNSKGMSKLDGSVKNKVYDFFEKLAADDTQPSLHIEPIKRAVDPRVRTGRVDIYWRAVLFRVDDKESGPTYIYMGTWPHDDAIKLAERATLRVNPINGTLEGLIGESAPAEKPKDEPVVASSPKPELSYLARVGYTLADLTDGLGINPALAGRAMEAPDESALLEVAAGGLEWEGSALLELATGMAIETIRENHGFAKEPIDPSLDPDQQIIAALERPASKMQFAFIEDNEELRRVIEGGDFAAWRTFLHPEQRKYVESDFSGAFRLSGGAGTGKTVVAIHRARRLSRDNPNARIVLTTFNSTLAQGLKTDLKALDPDVRIAERPGDPGVYVGGIDALARDVLNRAGDVTGEACERVFGHHIEFGSKRTASDAIWREVAQTVDSGLDAKLATPSFLETEYVAVVLANRVKTLEEYAKVARPGRGVRLSRPQRIAVWKLVDAFRRRSQMDETISFPEVLALAAEALRVRTERDGTYLTDHVIVDEAQDLHATHWALLRALVAEGSNDLFIAEDSHQRIYGSPVVLSRFGIKIIGRSRRLTLNYRTTAQNLHFAVSILSGAEYRDLEQGEESTSGYRSARNGPQPELISCPDFSAELQTVADKIKSWLAEGGVEPESIAVLTRSQDIRDRFVRGLGERGVSARAVDKNAPPPGQPLVMTMHRAKGMEFSRVVLAGADEKHVPLPASVHNVPEEEKDEAMLRERSLLYVASSRARDALVVTWSGKKSVLLGAQ